MEKLRKKKKQNEKRIIKIAWSEFRPQRNGKSEGRNLQDHRSSTLPGVI